MVGHGGEGRGGRQGQDLGPGMGCWGESEAAPELGSQKVRQAAKNGALALEPAECMKPDTAGGGLGRAAG